MIVNQGAGGGGAPGLPGGGPNLFSGNLGQRLSQLLTGGGTGSATPLGATPGVIPELPGTSGLFELTGAEALTADEDIGLPPAPSVAAPGFKETSTAPAIRTQSGSVPVVNAKPVQVELESDPDGGFVLIGAPVSTPIGLSTPIHLNTRVNAAGEVTRSGFQGGFSTTPEVLAAAIAGFDNLADYRAAGTL